jgi:subtilisin
MNVSTAPATYDQNVAGLDSGTTYVFRSAANNGKEFDDGPLFTFTTSGLNVDTNQPSGVFTENATLNGEVTDLGGASSTDVWFTYWEKGAKSSTQQWTSKQTLTSTGSYSARISGLNSNTTYVVRAAANNGNTHSEGSEVGFTTNSNLGVQTNSASGVGSTTATLNGDLTGLGDSSSSEVWFTYWEKGAKSSTQQWTSKQTLTSTGSYSAGVSGLNPNTTYVVQAAANNGDTHTSGIQIQFTTNKELAVQTNTATNVGSTSTTLNGDLTGLGDSSSSEVWFTYWEKGAKSSTQQWTSKQTLTSTGSFSANVSGLSPNTTYVVQAAANNGDTHTNGNQIEFTSNSELNVETKSATNVGSNSATLNGELTGLGNSGSSEVWFTYWEKGAKSSTQQWTSKQSVSSTGIYDADVSGLESGTTYVVKAATNNGEAYDSGVEKEFTTS